MSFFAELKRRKVFRVAVVYAATAFVLLQGADLMASGLGLPAWFFPVVFGLLILGFPVALVMGWALELTPGGVKVAPRRNEAAVDEPLPSLLGKRTVFVAALLVAVGIGLGAGWFLRPAPSALEPVASSEPVADTEDAPKPVAEPSRKSIAVLPFTNMSDDREQEFFADGITEDILTRLAAIGELRVISRTSVMRYKGTTLGIPEIAAELGVSHVLEGSVRRAGDRVRITGQLIRAEDDAHLWAESFDRELADIFAVQTEIAEQIVERLELQLTDRERRRLALRGTENPLAYEHYLRGRAAFSRPVGGRDDFRARTAEAERWFRAALAEDSGFGAAEAGLARVLRVSLLDVPADERVAHLESAAAAARRAIRLSPEMAAGYAELGNIYRAMGREDGALEQLELAARLEPDAPEALWALAVTLWRQGRFIEAIGQARRLIEVEPGQAGHHELLSQLYLSIGALDAAEGEHLRAWGELSPHPTRVRTGTARIQILRGDLAAARANIDEALALAPDGEFFGQAMLLLYRYLREADALGEVLERHRVWMEQTRPLQVAEALAMMGWHADISDLLNEAERQLRERLPRPSLAEGQHDLAIIAVLRGEHEVALDYLERAFDLGWRFYRELAINPTWDPIRNDPRFKALELRVDEDLARIRAELVAMEAGQ